jgi:hypothetical protein
MRIESKLQKLVMMLKSMIRKFKLEMNILKLKIDFLTVTGHKKQFAKNQHGK